MCLMPVRAANPSITSESDEASDDRGWVRAVASAKPIIRRKPAGAGAECDEFEIYTESY